MAGDVIFTEGEAAASAHRSRRPARRSVRRQGGRSTRRLETFIAGSTADGGRSRDAAGARRAAARPIDRISDPFKRFTPNHVRSPPSGLKTGMRSSTRCASGCIRLLRLETALYCLRSAARFAAPERPRDSARRSGPGPAQNLGDDEPVDFQVPAGHNGKSDQIRMTLDTSGEPRTGARPGRVFQSGDRGRHGFGRVHDLDDLKR